MISEIMHNMSRHILHGGEEDRIQWAGRPGPETVCALLALVSLPAEDVASVPWPCPVESCLQSSGNTAQAAQWVGQVSLWLSQTHALYYVRNKTHTWL